MGSKPLRKKQESFYHPDPNWVLNGTRPLSRALGFRHVWGFLSLIVKANPGEFLAQVEGTNSSIDSQF